MAFLEDRVGRKAYDLLSPVRGAIKRWGSKRLKQSVWDSEFRHGKHWHSENCERPIICDYIQRYTKNGILLDLGCSDGLIGLTIDENCYSAYIGVDISNVSIEKAIEKCARISPTRAQKNIYFVSDISNFGLDSKIDVILFRQSLYYLPESQIKKSLTRYRMALTPEGVFIVVMSDIKRHQWIVDIIRKGFHILEDTTISDTIILVFR